MGKAAGGGRGPAGSGGIGSGGGRGPAGSGGIGSGGRKGPAGSGGIGSGGGRGPAGSGGIGSGGGNGRAGAGGIGAGGSKGPAGSGGIGSGGRKGPAGSGGIGSGGGSGPAGSGGIGSGGRKGPAGSGGIGDVFKIGLPGPVLDDEARKVLERINPMAVILFGRNIKGPEQVLRLVEDVTAFLGRRPLFAVDQEGGLVTRLTRGFTVMPPAMAVGRACEPPARGAPGRDALWSEAQGRGAEAGDVRAGVMDGREAKAEDKMARGAHRAPSHAGPTPVRGGASHARGAHRAPSHARGVWNTEAQSKGAEGGSAETGGAQEAFRAGQIIGREMRAVGLDWNLAPVVDVNCNPQNRGIGIRSFSTDTGMVIRCARSFIRGLEESGVRSCLKHFPGLGGVENDPHLKLPVLKDSRSVIESRDLRPFREIPSACWMPTHVYVPALQSREEPVTLSREVLTDFIRGQLGFDGILVADDLNMGGVMNSVSLEEAVVRSFEAGMDVLSVCEGAERQCRAFEALEKAVSESEYLQLRLEESRERIQRFIDLRRDLPEGDQRAGVSELRLPESLRTAEDIARKAVVMVKQGPDIKGGMSFDNIFAMEMERQVPVEQTVNVRELEAARILGREMQCGCHFFSAGTLPEEEERLLGYAGKRRNLFFLENAYLNEDICSFVQRMLSVSAAHCVVALRNPWDADIPGVENAVCAYGYTPAQQKALLQFLRRKVLCTAAS